MRSFKDTNGATWPVGVNVATVKRVIDLADVNLLTVVDNQCELLTRLYDDPLTLASVLYAVCKPTIDERGVSEEKFAEALFGDCILDAAEALVAELVDFFPDPRRRQALTQILQKMKAVGNRLMDHVATEIEGLDTEALAKKCIDSVSSSPDSSASSPGG
jgi:hypothetical protein